MDEPALPNENASKLSTTKHSEIKASDKVPGINPPSINSTAISIDGVAYSEIRF